MTEAINLPKYYNQNKPNYFSKVEKEYFAPSKSCGEFLGITLHDDWGLRNHAEIQEAILTCPNRFEGEKSVVIKYVASMLPHSHLYKGRILFDYVMGCVSQFNYNDILYFLKYENYRDRPEETTNRTKYIRSFIPNHLQWVPCEATLDKIETRLMELVKVVHDAQNH